MECKIELQANMMGFQVYRQIVAIQSKIYDLLVCFIYPFRNDMLCYIVAEVLVW